MGIYKLILFILCLGFMCCQDDKRGSETFKTADSIPRENSKTLTADKTTRKHLAGKCIEYYQLKNDSVDFKLSILGSDYKKLKFKLELVRGDRIQKLSGLAELILVEDSDGSWIIPEGTPILDDNIQEEYSCDSTYTYDTDKIQVSFGKEIKARKRLCLGIYGSKFSGIKDNYYTLYRIAR